MMETQADRLGEVLRPMAASSAEATNSTVAPVAPTSPPHYDVGGAIRAWRRLRRLSQTDLAAAVRLQYSDISRIENGKQGLSVYQLMLVAEALGATPGAFFMGGEDDASLAKRAEAFAVIAQLPERHLESVVAMLRGLERREWQYSPYAARGRTRAAIAWP